MNLRFVEPLAVDLDPPGRVFDRSERRDDVTARELRLGDEGEDGRNHDPGSGRLPSGEPTTHLGESRVDAPRRHQCRSANDGAKRAPLGEPVVCRHGQSRFCHFACQLQIPQKS